MENREPTAAEIEMAERLSKPSLEDQLVSILMRHCGERGDNEGAVETLERIIRERDEAQR